LKVCGSITGIFGDAIPEEVTGLSWSKIGASGEGSGENSTCSTPPSAGEAILSST